MEGDSTAKIQFSGQTYVATKGSNLRKVLLEQGAPLYNGSASALNCRGLGTCGTCAIRIVKGEAQPARAIERWRLSFPPHRPDSELRLACQIEVLGDLTLEKLNGFWGERKDL